MTKFFDKQSVPHFRLLFLRRRSSLPAFPPNQARLTLINWLIPHHTHRSMINMHERLTSSDFHGLRYWKFIGSVLTRLPMCSRCTCVSDVAQIALCIYIYIHSRTRETSCGPQNGHDRSNVIPSQNRFPGDSGAWNDDEESTIYMAHKYVFSLLLPHG